MNQKAGGAPADETEIQISLLDQFTDVQEFSRNVFGSIEVAAFVHRNDSAQVDLNAVLAAACASGVKAGFDEAAIIPLLAKHLAENMKLHPIKSAVRTKDPKKKPSTNEQKLRALVDRRIAELRAGMRLPSTIALESYIDGANRVPLVSKDALRTLDINPDVAREAMAQAERRLADTLETKKGFEHKPRHSSAFTSRWQSRYSG
jgi:hypothetical protein